MTIRRVDPVFPASPVTVTVTVSDASSAVLGLMHLGQVDVVIAGGETEAVLAVSGVFDNIVDPDVFVVINGTSPQHAAPEEVVLQVTEHSQVRRCVVPVCTCDSQVRVRHGH